MDTKQCQVCGNFFVTDISLINHIETHSKKELYQCIIGLKQALILIHAPQNLATPTNLSTSSAPTPASGSATPPNVPTPTNQDMASPASGTPVEVAPEGIEEIPKLKEEGVEGGEESKGMSYKVPSRQEELEKYYAAQLAILEQMHNMQSSEMLYGSNNLGVGSSEEGEGVNTLLSCEICQRKFSTPYTLKRHMMSHANKRPDICPICGKGFIGKQNLVVHLRIHTGEKPYKCNICGKAFTQYGTLYRHKQIHTAKDGQEEHSAMDVEGGQVPENLEGNEENVESIRHSSDTGDENDLYEDVQRPSNGEQQATGVGRTDVNNMSMLQEGFDNVSSNSKTYPPNSVVSGSVDLAGSSSINSMDQLNRNHSVDTSAHHIEQMARGHTNTSVVHLNDQQEVKTQSHVTDGTTLHVPSLSEPLHLSQHGQTQLATYQAIMQENRATLGALKSLPSEVEAGYSKIIDSSGGRPSYDHPPSYTQGQFQSPNYSYLQSQYNLYSGIQNTPQTPAEAHLNRPVDRSSNNSNSSLQGININKTESHREPLQSFSSLTESLLRKRNLSPGVIANQTDSSVNKRNTLSDSLSSHTPNQSNSSHVVDYSALLSYKPPSSLSSTPSYLQNSATYGSGTIGSDKPEPKSDGFSQLVCKFCTLKFDSQVALDAHQKLHTEKNLVWCDICHCKFTTPFSLRRHMKIHTGERSEECSICGKRFIDKPRLVVHMRTHTGDKPYKCTVCIRTFSRRDALRRHLKTHGDPDAADVTPDSKAKPYENEEHEQEDEEVKRASNASALMYVHLDNNNKPTVSTYISQQQEQNKENGTTSAEAPSETPSASAAVKTDTASVKSENESNSSEAADDMDCPDQAHDHPSMDEGQEESHLEDEEGLVKPAVSRSINEINDMLMKNFTTKVEGPKPYRCDVCCRTYTMPSCLRRHMLVHTGLKPNKCDVCGKSFVEKQQLAVHYRIHTGERPHKCQICFKRFTQYGTLHNHMQVHKKQQISEAMDKIGIKHEVDSDSKDDHDSDVIHPSTTSANNGTIHHDLESPSMSDREKVVESYSHIPAELRNKEQWEGSSQNQDTPITRPVEVDPPSEGSAAATAEHEEDDSAATYATRYRYATETNDAPNVPVDNTVTPQNNRSQDTPPNGTDVENESTKPPMDPKNIKTEQQELLNRYPFDFYSNMYGFPAAGLMSLNLLASTSEFHQSLIEYMGQVQRARMLGLSDLASATSFTENQDVPNAATSPKDTESNDVGLNLSVNADDKTVGHKCEKCNMQFLDKSALLNHMQSHVTSPSSSTSEYAMMSMKGGKSHTCKTCGKSFSASFCLRRHEMIHSGHKPFKCDLCPKAFVEKQHLACHRRIHTGEKPFSCKVCGKSFTQYGTLHKHLRTHTKDKKYKCQFCDKAYYERRQLTNHMLSHFEYRKHLNPEGTSSSQDDAARI